MDGVPGSGIETSGEIFSAAGLFSDDAVDKLSSGVSPIDNLLSLERAIGMGMVWDLW